MSNLTHKDLEELAEAGFPNLKLCSGHGKRDHYDPMCPQQEPTLSKLIEECGEGFALHMRPEGKGWKAWQINSSPREPNPANLEEEGKNPEQAVKNLYIALKKQT